MERSALFIVSSDPLTSHRPAEAVRIAAGIQAWQRVRVRLYLHHPALLTLAHGADTWREEDLLRQYLPALATAVQPIYVPAGLPRTLDRDLAPIHLLEIPRPQLAAIAAQSTWVLRF